MPKIKVFCKKIQNFREFVVPPPHIPKTDPTIADFWLHIDKKISKKEQGKKHHQKTNVFLQHSVEDA